MSLITVKKKYQIVIPEEVRKNIKVEIGDTLEVEEKNGVMILKPVTVIDKAQTYFWTEEWQKGGKAAEEEKKKGRFRDFNNADEAARWLKS